MARKKGMDPLSYAMTPKGGELCKEKEQKQPMKKKRKTKHVDFEHTKSSDDTSNIVQGNEFMLDMMQEDLLNGFAHWKRSPLKGTDVVETITREKRQRYLTVPYGGRNACSSSPSGKCRGQVDFMEEYNVSLGLVEYLSDEEEKVFLATGKNPSTTGLCELCITYIFHTVCMRAMRYDKTDIPVVPHHYHMFGKPGEYKLESMIVPDSRVAGSAIMTVRLYDRTDYVPGTVVILDPATGKKKTVQGLIETPHVFF